MAAGGWLRQNTAKCLGWIAPPFVALHAPVLVTTVLPTPHQLRDTPLTECDHMATTSVFHVGCARMKHKSTPTANESWWGAASTSPRTFSRGVHPKVPVLARLVSPRPVVFTTRTRVLWLGVRQRVRFDRLSGCGKDNETPHITLLFAPAKRYPCCDVPLFSHSGEKNMIFAMLDPSYNKP